MHPLAGAPRRVGQLAGQIEEHDRDGGRREQGEVEPCQPVEVVVVPHDDGGEDE